MHYKSLVEQKYIGVFALPPGQDLIVTITGVASERLTFAGGRTETCAVVKLAGQLPLIANATNRKALARLFGTETDNWVGKSFTLYAAPTTMGGEAVEGLRIRPTVPNVAPVKRSLKEDRFSKALVSIETGDFTVAELLEKYELTEEQQSRLPKQLEAGEAQ